MADVAALTQLIEPEAQALGFALVRVRMFGGKGDRTLQIMAERPDTRQLTIDDCAELSRRVSDRLDALDGTAADPIADEYRLEVSSPGIDRPLTRRQDWADWAGHEARIVLKTPPAPGLEGGAGARKQFKGVIAGIDPEGVIALDVGRDEHAFIPFEQVADAKLAMTDKLIAATQPLSAEGADDVIELSASADGVEEAEAEEKN